MVVSFSYNSPSNTVTATSTTTTFFDDWVAADIANYGTWGFHTIAKLGSAHYHIYSKLIVGDDSTPTNVSDKNKTISWDVNVRLADGQANILVKNNATVTFGVLQDLTSKATSDGCHFFEENTHYGNFIKANIDSLTCVIYLYSCCFNAINRECSFEAQRAWDCHVINNAYCGRSGYNNTPQNINNLLGATSFTLLRSINANFTINNILAAINGGYIFYCGASNGIYKNVIASLKAGCYIARLYGIGTFDQQFINVVANAWNFSWNDTSTGKLWRKYTFDLKVVDCQNDGVPLQNARVRIYDKNGVEITQTGIGYTTTPTVNIVAPPPGGTQATATAILGSLGQILSFTITNPGSGYVFAPAITFSGGGSGSGATAVSTINGNGGVASITPTLYTDSNGNITTITLILGYYDQAHGDILQSSAPLQLKISKNGYMNYTDKMTPTIKTQYQVSMNRTVPVILTSEGRMLVDMKPTDPQSLVYTEI